jgi:LysR family hydrogen peroxide-inducible transcriptional activator
VKTDIFYLCIDIINIMTLQQLEYVTAVDTHRHFVKAAEQCHVTQPTLSAMILKLEEEFGCRLFDRSVQPVEPTATGVAVIRHARQILFHVKQLKEYMMTQRSGVSGPLYLALIPTVAPYILPGLLTILRQGNPDISLKVSEMRTSVVVEKLRLAEIDMAILATPLAEAGILEVPLYYEKFVAYISPDEPYHQETEVQITSLPASGLWLLEEGHCLRSQVLNICENPVTPAVYEAGSIDTLVKIVDQNGGFTIIPELHLPLLSESQKANIRPIVRPEATREISLVFREDYFREGMVNALAEAVRQIIPATMVDERLKRFAIRL